MPGNTPAIPLVNGHRYSFASIELRANNKTFIGIKSINYKDKLDKGNIWGTSSKKIGRTRGKQDPDASFEMLKAEGQDLIDNLTGNNADQGYGEISFNITVAYREQGSSVITDTIEGAMIIEADDSHSEGTDAVYTKFSLNVMDVKRNGKSIASRQQVATA